MNKMELVAGIAEKSNLSKKDAELALEGMIMTISEALEEGEKVQLVGFGTFDVGTRKARTGRNPRTGEEIEIPASKLPRFKAGKSLKDRVNA